MNWTKWNRRIHRWVSMMLMGTVLLATYAAATGQDTESMLYYLPLVPLFILMASGRIMFVLHYLAEWRSAPNVG